MPSNLMMSDSSFPQFTGETTEEKVNKIQNYLYMLLEQLRYSLGNISMDNMNSSDLESLAGYITEPVTMHLSDIDGRVTDLVTDVDGISLRVADAEGNAASAVATANALQTRVQNAEGSISSLTQTAAGLTTRVQNTEGAVSQVQQLVNGISLSVDNGSTSSTIKLTSNGVQISSGTISFSGMVKFSDLSTAGNTTINGANITTGTITGRLLSGCTIDCTITNLATAGLTADGQMRFLVGSNVVGGLRFDTQGGGGSQEAWSRLFLYTKNWGTIPIPLKLESEAGMSLKALTEMYLDSVTLTIQPAEYGYVRTTNLRIYPWSNRWAGNYWEFRNDGIYYGGVKKV